MENNEAIEKTFDSIRKPAGEPRIIIIDGICIVNNGKEIIKISIEDAYDKGII